MKQSYFYSVLTLLFFFSFVNAQTNNSFERYKGYEQSVNHGVLSSLKTNNSLTSLNNIGNTFNSSTLTAYDFHGVVSSSMNIPRAQCNDSQGNLYITGCSGNTETNSGDIVTVKITSNGTIDWTVRIPSAAFTVNSGTAITLGEDGCIYLVGYSWNQSSSDILCIKMNTNGQIVWQAFLGGNSDFDMPTSLTVDASGQVYIASLTHAITKVTYRISKLSSSGLILWESIDPTFPDNTWNEPKKILLDGSDNIVVCGYGFQSEEVSKTVTIKYSQSGQQLWKNYHTFLADVEGVSSPTNGWPVDFTIDGQNNLYVSSNYSGEFYQHSKTVKHNPNGEELWFLNHQTNEANTSIKQIVLFQDKLIVAGYQYGSGQDGFVVEAINFEGVVQWADTTTNQYSPSKFSMHLASNSLFIDAVSMDSETFGSLIYSNSYNLLTGDVIDSSFLALNDLTEGYSLNDFFKMMPHNGDKVYTLSPSYSYLGNVFEVRRLNSSTSNYSWITKFELQNSLRLNILETVADSNNNLFSLVSKFYVEQDDVNLLKQKSYLLKYNSQGNLVSNLLIDDAVGLTKLRLAIDSSDNPIVLIQDSTTGTYTMTKYTESLVQLWATNFIINSITQEKVVVDNENNIFLLTSTSDDNNTLDVLFSVTKFNSSGQLQFSNTYQPENTSLVNSYLSDAIMDNDGSILICGVATDGASSSQSEVFQPVLCKVSSAGVLQFFKNYSLEDTTSATVKIRIENNNTYLAVGLQNTNTGANGINLLKINSLGIMSWEASYFEQDSDLFLQNLLFPESSNKLYIVNSKISTTSQNIKIVSFDLNGSVVGSTILDAESYYQDSNCNNQHVVILAQNQASLNFPFRLLNWIGPFISSKVFLLNFDLTVSSSNDLVGQNYSLFEPKQLIPLANANFIVSGRLFHEELFFEGIKFFEVLSQPDLDLPEYDKLNNQFYIFPNPTSSTSASVLIKSRTTDFGTLKLFDVTGKYLGTLADVQINSGETTVSLLLPNLKEGIYFLSLVRKNEILTQKLVIKH